MTEPGATLIAALRWLHGNPNSSAGSVAAGLGRPHDHRFVYMLLQRAEENGWAQRTKPSAGAAWLWETLPDGFTAITASETRSALVEANTAHLGRAHHAALVKHLGDGVNVPAELLAELRGIADGHAANPGAVVAAARHFAAEWRELLGDLPDSYGCEMTCGEAEAAAELYRALDDAPSAAAIIAAHAAHDIDGEQHYQPPRQQGPDGSTREESP